MKFDCFKILKIIFLLVVISFFIFLIIASISLFGYYQRQKENKNLANFCVNNCRVISNKNFDETAPNEEVCHATKNIKIDCYNRIMELMLPYMLLYEAYIDDEPLKFAQLDYQDTYKVVIQMAQKSDVLFGYGIGVGKCAFEDTYQRLFKKPVFGFDCGVKKEETGCQICNFESECIATDKFLIIDQVSSGKIHYFGEKLKQLNLENKKIYIKMDIAGAEKEALKDIIKYPNNVSAITFVLHTNDSIEAIDNLELLKALNKDFILVSRSNIMSKKSSNFENHMKYVKGEDLIHAMALSYVNKNMVDSYKLKLNQDNKTNYIDLMQYRSGEADYEPPTALSWQVLISHFLKKILK